MKLDDVLRHSCYTQEVPWFNPKHFCADGLPTAKAGTAYTWRYHLCLIAILRLMDLNEHTTDEVVPVDDAGRNTLRTTDRPHHLLP